MTQIFHSPTSVIDPNVPQPENLLVDGILRLLLSVEYDRFNPDGLRLWCHHNGRYGLPTMELVDWLHGKIAGRSTIEIGAGAGDLCHHLNIPGTDNMCQLFPDVRFLYALGGQPIVPYGQHVDRYPADRAVEVYQPDVVVASWVTEWLDPDLPVPPQGGNAYGVKEDELLDGGVEYILIGNKSVHGRKKIMQRKHEEFNLPFLRSRSLKPELNRVWIWKP